MRQLKIKLLFLIPFLFSGCVTRKTLRLNQQAYYRDGAVMAVEGCINLLEKQKTKDDVIFLLKGWLDLQGAKK